MASKITYENKVGLENDETIQRKNKVIDADMNEIKNVVNEHADDLTQKDVELADIKKDSNNILRGVEEVEKLTSTGTWANRTWRQSSTGTGVRERIDITDLENIKKGWHIASTNLQVTISQDNVPTEKDKFYIISCYAKGTGKVYLQYGNGALGYQNTQIDVTSDWKEYIYIFKSKGTANSYFGVNGTGYDIQICNMKLYEWKLSKDEFEKYKNQVDLSFQQINYNIQSLDLALSRRQNELEDDMQDMKTELEQKDTEQDIEIDNIKTVQNSESSLLSGVETVTGLTSTGTWANRTWRSASGGTGTRERIDIENGPNSLYKKGWKLTGSTGGNTDICQDSVPVTFGQSYRLSCYARKISGEPVLRMQYGKNPYTSETYMVNDTEWQKYEFIFEAGKTTANCSGGNTNIYFGVSNCIGTLEICGLRLEKVDDRIEKLENENKYLKELNSSLQETVLDTQTEVSESIVVNDSCERYWNDKCTWWAKARNT